MQDAIDQTVKTFSDPSTHVRDIEKSKLIPQSGTAAALIENFTGDHKLKNFKSKLDSTEKTKLKLSDYLMKTSNAQEKSKKVLQDQKAKPMIVENEAWQQERRQMVKSFNKDIQG